MDEQGPINIKNLLVLILGVVVLIETIALGIIGFNFSKVNAVAKLNQQQIDQKVADESARIQSDFDAKLGDAVSEEVNRPFDTYTARDLYGAFSFKYPHFFHVYVEDASSTQDQLTILIDKNAMVKSGNNEVRPFLKVQLQNTDYERELKEIEDDNRTRLTNKMTITDVSVSGIFGKVIKGKIDEDWPDSKTVILPYRDKTLYIIGFDYKATLMNKKSRESFYDEIVKSFDLRK